MRAGVRVSPMRQIALISVIATLLLPGLADARNLFLVARDGKNVSVLDLATGQQTLGSAALPENGFMAAITPDGTRAYVVSSNVNGFVSVIDVATNTVIGTPIPVGKGARGIAITPDGSRAYVTNRDSNLVDIGGGNFADSVSVIDTATNTVTVPSVIVGNQPEAIAISPDGSKVYVANSQGTDSRISVISTATNTVTTTIPLSGDRRFPIAIGFTPDGRKAYIANRTGSAGNFGTVSVVDVATDSYLGNPIPIGANTGPSSVGISPDGTRAYVGTEMSRDLYVIDTATDQIVAGPIDQAAGGNHTAIVSPDGSRAYYLSAGADTTDVSVLDTATNTLTGPPINTTANVIFGGAIVPNQGPSAAFTATPGGPGTATSFDAAAAADGDGAIARFDWDFGDGTPALANGGATPTHVYPSPGTYDATLTVTDNEGCSTGFVYTGQTASCNGGTKATITMPVVVSNTQPILKLGGKRKQVVGKAIKVKARCGPVACSVAVGGKLKIPVGTESRRPDTLRIRLRRANETLTADQTAVLKLKLPKSAREAFAQGASKGTARLKATATGAAGTKPATAERKIRIEAEESR